MFSDSFNKNITINAFSEKPFTFLNPQAHDNVAAIIEINLIENGSRASRENWQLKQLNNGTNKY